MGSVMVDLTGMVFGRLTVIERNYQKEKELNKDYKKRYWTCKCECGNETVVPTGQLTTGKTRSCGCLRNDCLAHASTTHGLSWKSRLYSIWNGMKSRCYNSNQKSFANYGARGVRICDEWMDFSSFYNWAINNGWNESDKNISIDRINVDGNYEPCNCRFVTNKQQANNKTTSHFLSFNGETHTIAEWSEIVGLDQSALYYRITHGWDVEKALTTGSGETRIKKLTYNGETKTAKEWSELLNIDESLIMIRSSSGWSDEDILTTPKYKSRNKPAYSKNSRLITYNGETKSISEFAEQYGMSQSLLTYRLSSGMSLEDALNKPVRHYNWHETEAVDKEV